MKKKVAIVAGSASRDDAPYDNPEWEIWGCNEMSYKRFDFMFELHPMDVQKEELEYLRKCKKPVYVLDAKDAKFYGIKKPIEYPLKEILEQQWAISYFCCTMAYQIALAIYKGFETIGLWGLRMDIGSPRERTVESASIQWWLGVAKGKGIEVIWDEHPAKNRLLYGYHYYEEIARVDSWLYQLAIHTIYRLGGRHICVGGDNEPIRRTSLIKKPRKKPK